MNVTQEQEKIEVEDMRNALIASLQAYTQAIPQMATSGADPSSVINKIAEVIKARQGGKSIEDAIGDIFAPENPPAGSTPSVEQTSPVPAGAPVGGPTSPEEVPQGQPQGAPMESQEAPTIQSLFASMSGNGEATSTARTVNRR